jgi:hypothetical protein
MSPDQRVDGVVLECLLKAGTPRMWQMTPQNIVSETGLPRRQVARSINRLRALEWIRWERIPRHLLPGWVLTDVGAMAAADYPRPYYADDDGCIGPSRGIEPGEDEEWCVREVIMTPREHAALTEVEW